MLFFSWIRRQTAQSVMLGFADAAKALAPEGEDDAPQTVEELRALLASGAGLKQLAAPVADDEPEPTAKGKRAKS